MHHGEPTLRRSSILVRTVVERMRIGDTPEQIVEDYPTLTLAGVTILQSKKKPRGQELTPEEKEDNRLISKIRIRIEHAIGGVKRYRIVRDKIRNWKQSFRYNV